MCTTYVVKLKWSQPCGSIIMHSAEGVLLYVWAWERKLVIFFGAVQFLGSTIHPTEEHSIFLGLFTGISTVVMEHQLVSTVPMEDGRSTVPMDGGLLKSTVPMDVCNLQFLWMEDVNRPAGRITTKHTQTIMTGEKWRILATVKWAMDRIASLISPVSWIWRLQFLWMEDNYRSTLQVTETTAQTSSFPGKQYQSWRWRWSRLIRNRCIYC